ncbi:metallophosphoesterase [Pseudoalteromonas sp. SSDWG2]|uniref:metallophosphoesterase n=1 Tax=Pseudoalteromonas sp. SSDWG2 TaxID=3139391 RepID=UPI003BAAFEDD
MTWFNSFSIPHERPLYFGHFTDCHLFADLNGQYFDENCADNLLRTLDVMATENFDFVVFGGDLTQDHSEQSYRVFADLIAKSALACPVFWVPGNHDDIALLERMSEGQIRACKLIEHPFANILLINTKGTTPAGWIQATHLEQIEGMLRRSDTAKVLIGHHHPLPVDGYIDKHILDNGSQLLALTDRVDHKVKAVLHGHAHNRYERHYNGVRILGTPATSIQFTKHTTDWQQQCLGPAYRTCLIDQDGELITDVKWLEN